MEPPQRPPPQYAPRAPPKNRAREHFSSVPGSQYANYSGTPLPPQYPAAQQYQQQAPPAQLPHMPFNPAVPQADWQVPPFATQAQQVTSAGGGIFGLLRLVFTFAMLGSAAWGLRSVFATLSERFLLPLLMPSVARLAQPLNKRDAGDDRDTDGAEEGQDGDSAENGLPTAIPPVQISKPGVRDEVKSLKEEVSALVKMVKTQGTELRGRFDGMAEHVRTALLYAPVAVQCWMSTCCHWL